MQDEGFPEFGVGDRRVGQLRLGMKGFERKGQEGVKNENEMPRLFEEPIDPYPPVR